MTNFIPDHLQPLDRVVPYFEDHKSIPGYRTTKSTKRLQNEIASLFDRLGGGGVTFIPGTFDGKPLRYGYSIAFFLEGGVKGRIEIAALPLRHYTDTKKEKALAQALYLLRNKLEAQAFELIYEPGSIPLLPYLIGEGGRTVTEALIGSGALPQLTAGGAFSSRS